MKTFMEIAKEAQKVEKELRLLQEEKQELHYNWKDGIESSDMEAMHKAYEKMKARVDEIYYNEEPKKELRLRFLNANAKYVLIKDYLPKIIGILGKYEGKSYGVKTKEKIANEIKENLDICFYIGNDRSFTFWHREYHPHGYDAEIYNTNWESKMLINNKIQIYPIEELEWYGDKKYTEDIDAAIDNFLKAYKEVYEAQKELKSKIAVLNSLGAEHMNFTEQTTYRERFTF